MISLDQWLSSGGDVRKKGKWERKLSPFYLKTQTNNNKKNPLYFKHVQTTNSWLLLRMEWPYDNSHFYFFYFNDV